jgi:NAD(P)-dependent dehydrogenase (short-subunit alcohol dehydrogenase family)
VARCLIIGCGCRGRSLARALLDEGHTVRGTTRDPSGTAAIEAVGAEAYVGDPDRVATLSAALEHVAIACVLLGSATGPADQLAALHGPRLEMLLTRMLDTTVRGVVYEARGSIDPAVLAGGGQRVRAACRGSRIPYALFDADPGDHETWVRGACDAFWRLLRA